MFGKRILILAAHPDDEVVACAASIARARAQGASLAVLYLTHGCIARETLWPWQRKNYETRVEKRRTEANAAAAFLGIKTLSWTLRAARFLWRDLSNILKEIEAAIDLYRPDQLWVPTYEGGNPDHDALNAVGFKLKSRLSVLEFAEYNYFGGTARAQRFIASEETARIITLTNEERALKKAALALYASEAGNLSYVGLEQESYRPIAHYDYGQPPHQGKLWYARFQWVPFHHPRVDYTDAKDVSKAIKQFLL